MIGFAAGMEMADMAWEVKCREEDMKQRALENERHAIDDARRSVDEKAEQLKVLANQSALFAGFSMVVLVESSIPEDISSVLLTVFGGTTALVIALMLVSTLNATYILVAILRYDCVSRDVPFDEFWRKRCEPDWKLALRCFSYGVPLFLLVVALVAWVSFWDHPAMYVSSSIVTGIVLAVTIFYFGRTERKWTGYLLSSDARLLRRGSMSMRNMFGASHHGSSNQSRDDGSRDNNCKEGGSSGGGKRGGGGGGDSRNGDGGGDDSRHDGDHHSSVESLNISSLAIGELTQSDRKMLQKTDRKMLPIANRMRATSK